jgi:hypothetical protein
MFIRRGLVPGSLVFLCLIGCGREMSRSLAPTSGIHVGAVSSRSSNLPPITTILSPPLSIFLTSLLPPPVTIQWSGSDADGDVREYRYRLFVGRNPDFPNEPDFPVFFESNPDSVLRFYAPKFTGWERLRVGNGSDTASVTYTALIPGHTYVFAVVAIDNRGTWDAHLTRARNMLAFQVPFGSEPLGTVGERPQR